MTQVHNLTLGPLEAALDEERYQDAWTESRGFGDPRAWRGPRGRVLAGRLAFHLGAPRLGTILHEIAGREHPEDPEAVLARSWHRMERVGPYATWTELDAIEPLLPRTDPTKLADWLALRARIAVTLRDFTTARGLIAQALELDGRPWVRLQVAQIEEREDHPERAEEIVDEVLGNHPRSRLGVQLKAHFLRSRGEDDKALVFLYGATRHVDHPFLQLQLAQIQLDLELWADAEESLAQFGALAPLLHLDRQMRRSLDAMRAQIAYSQGRLAEAAELYDGLGDASVRDLAARLRDPNHEDGRRVLEVPWVRQRHDTCSPATLASICRYWGHGAEHLEIAEAICYGGTPAHSERRWARENRLTSHEFTVDWPTAVALLDRGVPFTLVTSDAANAHLQAVVGYDLRRRSFLCRDPSVRQLVELDADRLLEILRSTGPRGMVLLPPEEESRLAGVRLPEAELYDGYDAVESALAAHRRDEAVAHVRRLGERAPGHRLELWARRAVAAYDQNLPRQLEAVEALLRLHPKDQRLQLSRLSCMEELGLRRERVEELRRRAAQRDADPLVFAMLASELAADERYDRETWRWLSLALRRRPESAAAYGILGEWLWRRGERQRATLLFRWAACLDEVNEDYQRHYLVACRLLGLRDEALDFLRRRVERLGGRSGRPWTTLASALGAWERHDEALTTLEEGLRLRPTDEHLASHMVSARFERGQLDEAGELIAAMEGRMSPAVWHDLKAVLAELRGDLPAALEVLRRLLEQNPTAAHLHARIAQLATTLHGHGAGLEHLRQAVGRFPHHAPLNELLVRLTWQEGPQAVTAVLRRLLAVDADNAWAWRELTGALIKLRDLDGAADAVARAAEIEPSSAALDNVAGELLEERGELDQALERYREAIRKEPDNAWAIGRLPAAGRTASWQRDSLRWIAGELGRSTYGTGLDSFHRQAQRFLPPDEVEKLLAGLHEALAARWTSWHAMACQKISMGRYDEALEWIREAASRFPFQVEIRRLEAQVYQETRRQDDEESTLRGILAIEPADARARVRLARLCLDRERTEMAERECEIGRAHHPLDPSLILTIAELKWQQEDRAGALARVEEALELDLSQMEVWETLDRLGKVVGEPERALRTARRLLETRRDDPMAWSVMAEVAKDPKEALRAIDRALELAPLASELHLRKVGVLRRSGDLSAAFAACRPAVFGEHRPTELLGEEADLLGEFGDREAAIRTMQRAVAEDPCYGFGWAKLAEWYRERKSWEEMEDAARRWTVLAPTDAIGWGFLGDAFYGRGNGDAALEAFGKALALEPAYAYGGLRTAEILRERHQEPAALRVLSELADNVKSSQVFLKTVETALASGGHPHVGRWIHGFALAADGHAEIAAELLRLVADSPEYLRIFDEAAAGDETVAPMLAIRALGLAETEGFDAAWEHLTEVGPINVSWGEAAAALLREEVGAGNLWRAAARLKDYDVQIHRPTRSWGAATFVWAQSGQWQKLIEWAEDWQSRTDVEPWMLVNVSLAHRVLGRDAAAYQVSRAALPNDPEGTEPYHRFWVATWEAVRGNASMARGLPPENEDELSPEDRNLYRMAKALAEVAGRRGDGNAFRRARRWLRGGSRRLEIANSFQRRIYDRVVYRIAREVGGLGAWFWAVAHWRPGWARAS